MSLIARAPMTSTPVDVASLAGTWVAAGLAIFGIFAILGPLLVWRASRTQRHKALMSVGLDNNRYLSDGIPVWPGIRLFQRERVPLLMAARPYGDKEWLDFDLSRIKVFPASRASWTQYGACLEAYGVTLPRGRALHLNGEDLRLPVHMVYLMLFLVIGRYQKPVVGITAGSPSNTAGRITSIAIRLGSREPAQEQSIILRGLTGFMRFETPFDRSYYRDLSPPTGEVTFVPEPPGRIEMDGVSVAATLFLAHGFVVLPSAQYLCIADDILSKRELVAQTIDSDGSDNDSSPAVRPSYQTPFTHAQRKARKMIESFEIFVFDLIKLPAKSFELPGIGSYVPGEPWTLSRMPKSTAEQIQLQELASKTYVPADERYVRFAHKVASRETYRDRTEDDTSVSAFLTRRAAQIFAMAIMSLPWSRKNYVIGSCSGSTIIYSLLLDAGSTATRFLVRLKADPAILDLEQADTATFLAAADKVLLSEGDVADLCDLDEVLSILQHKAREVPLMLGVLLLTNAEFRDIIYQSARHVKGSGANAQGNETELDLDNGQVTVIGAFGVRHVFVVDLDELLEHLPGLPRSQERNLKVDLATVLLAAMKAFVRSLMLARRIDGADIERAMSCERDVYYMS